LKGNQNIAQKIEALGIEKVRVTIITACELYFGAYNSQNHERNIAMLDELLSLF
jgi:predicted nucleic acid-binding protein